MAIKPNSKKNYLQNRNSHRCRKPSNGYQGKGRERETGRWGLTYPIPCVKQLVRRCWRAQGLSLELYSDLKSGREDKREGACVHLWLTRFAVQQKLTQHYKAIILQLKKNNKKINSSGGDVLGI